ncbi:hypothetical protein [Pseudoalteromonas luteoviolacea]|uniref:Tyrosine specific protein phosphatases domain-containing protein n=1 Tax=Pseudoalteromonas luteoviolacea S4054 TaxID=1129367 RepID=A0A0F6AI22_9GAMM|nr:hypothetical protein [Pseudoalteromonas luteoviolacea]AOT07954.1 hypothetical protein S4054249_08905 [Pseudoalteromonas luteoviolacea]AOT12870.1 hypothetical protein S40542_08905 [Pseudoalteromonas luteoviolacea]AOT17783.1 hypothetical protein S4054_08900 [Pseudoalteromonas luteoviolacea]KKE85803.1 hypothetical protein N479_00085 [Pseudoalteromonas luteoviolacea S4054]KZN74681.1 hypothetical protein N481_08465 [Pseudoalteromonas luteoviolacea S4047-1]
MTTHPFDTFKTESGHTFFLTPCPGTKGVALFTSLKQLKEANVAGVITLMSDEELIQSGVTGLQAGCASVELYWWQFPMPDDGVPDKEFNLRWQKHLQHILHVVTQGKTVAVHSKGGSGRTCLMIGLLLLALGHTKAQSKRLVTTVWPDALTRSPQAQFFEHF